jgi:ketosteroid isomerase-like protein
MHPDVCVVFNDGTYRGVPEVRQAFLRTFGLIWDERYRISNVHWVSTDASYAVGMYDFSWSGLIDGRQASGGRRTCVLRNDGGRWLLLLEHLGPHPR